MKEALKWIAVLVFFYLAIDILSYFAWEISGQDPMGFHFGTATEQFIRLIKNDE